MHTAMQMRESDLAAILRHEEHWRSCFDYAKLSHNHSVLKDWETTNNSLVGIADLNLRNFWLAGRDFADAGTHARLAVSHAVLPRKLWAHELPWEVDFSPWREIVAGTSIARINHMLAIANNQILGKAVRVIKVNIGIRDQREIPERVRTKLVSGQIYIALRRFSNVTGVVVRNRFWDTMGG